MWTRPDKARADQVMDSSEVLFRKRIVFCEGPIGMPMSSPGVLADHLLALDSFSHDPIKMIIDSPGGGVSSGFSIIDTMQTIESPVWTIGRGCYSIAALILAVGDPGNRYVYPHSKVMLHLPWGKVSGDVEDLKIQTGEALKLKNEIVDILVEFGCTKSKKQILKDIDREWWMSATEAIEYGVADRILLPGVLI